MREKEPRHPCPYYNDECPKCFPPQTTPTPEWRRSEQIAMNIVHQIGDLLYKTLPPDVAHKYFVDARQATNDRAIDFAERLIEEHITSRDTYWKERVEEMTKMYEVKLIHLDSEWKSRFAKLQYDIATQGFDTPITNEDNLK